MYYLATDIFSIVFALPHPFPNLSLLEFYVLVSFMFLWDFCLWKSHKNHNSIH